MWMLPESVLDALPDAIAVLDAGGSLLSTNDLWKRLGDLAAIGGNGPHEALREGLAAVLSGAQEQFCVDLSFDAGVGGVSGARFFTVTIASYPADGGRGAVIHQRDNPDTHETLRALRKSEEGLAAAQRLAHFGNWEWTFSNGVLVWSDEVYRIFGLQPQQFPATYDAFYATVHPEDRDGMTKAIKRAVDEQSSYDIEYRIMRPTGEVRVVHAKGEVQYNDRGEAVRMFGTVHDISERKHFEQLIRAQADALQQATVPLLPVSDDVVVLPVIGEVDAARAERVMTTLLEGIEQRRPSVAILDVTGVSSVDRFTAEALIRSACAARLLGVDVILTGLRPEVAQAFVSLGIDLGGLVTLRSLQRGIAYALGRAGPVDSRGSALPAHRAR